MKRLLIVVLLMLVPLVLIDASADEIKPGVLRTPDSRFEGLADFSFVPHYMQVGEIRLHYSDEGPPQGETILLIHGEPTWSYLSREMIPVFVKAGYRVIAPDLVGFGKSDKYVDEGAYSYADDLPVGDIMTLMGGDDRTRAAYEAPFPEQRYKAATQIMPYLVPSQLPENEAYWTSVYEQWDKPFLVAFTDSDPVSARGEQTFLKRVPTAQNVTIRGAGHFVQEDAGPELAALIVDFMQGHKLPAEITVVTR